MKNVLFFFFFFLAFPQRRVLSTKYSCPTCTECSVNHFPGNLCLSAVKLKSDSVTHALQQGTREPEVTIRLSSNSARLHNQVRYDLTCGAYRRVLASEDDLTLDLLTLPSRVIHRDLHNQMQQQQQQEQQQNKQSSKGWIKTFYTLIQTCYLQFPDKIGTDISGSMIAV